MIVNQLVEKAMKKAQGAQATLWQSESTKVSFENDKLKSAQSSQRTQINVKVIVDGKVGTSHTTDVHDLDGVVTRALESAEFGSPAHFQFPGPQEGTEVKVYDDAVLPVTKPEMIQTAQEMMELIKQHNSDILVNAGISKSVSRGEFANSGGVEFTRETTDFGVSISGQLVRGTDILLAGHGFGWKKRAIDHVAIAEQVIGWFRMAETIAPIKSGDMPVIFAPVGMGVLGLTLVLGFNGKNVLLGSSPLAGKLGKKIADQRLSLIDNPLIDYAGNSSKYDGEGIPRQVTPLIENGVVRNFLYDLDTAGRAGTKTTGHGTGCNPTNLLVKEGDMPYEEMVKSIKEGLLVLDVMGLGQGNPISGEFSVNVQLGYKIEDGEVVGRVKDVMLAGNVYDALNDIVAIGDKAEWLSAFGGSYLIPPIQIGSLSVVARQNMALAQERRR
jgi:PmbA protein